MTKRRLKLLLKPTVLLAIVGLVLFLRRAVRPALVSVLLAVSCIGYAINYDIHDIDAYFLTAYLVMAVWASVALATLLRWIPERLPGGGLDRERYTQRHRLQLCRQGY